MQLSIDQLSEALVTQLREPQLLKELKTISLNFTSNRKDIEAYTLSPEMVAAYTMFYLPTNIPKFSFLLNQLPKAVREEIGTCDFIDVGTGPGTYLLSFLDYFKDREYGYVWGIDSSREMRKQADKTLKTFFPDSDFYIGSSPPEKKGKQALFFGNSLNEMGLNAGINLIDDLEPEFVILIEPGTKEFFKEALKLRELMKDRGYGIHYPCFLDESCPMKEREGDWCHQVVRTTHHPSIERISQLVSKDRRNMPMIAHVYQKARKAQASNKFRLIRFLGETKFSFDWEVCGVKEANQVIKVEVLKKHHSKKECKDLKKTQVGESFEIEVLKELGPNHWRGRVLLP